MGEIGKDVLPEDIFADVEADISNNVVRSIDNNNAGGIDTLEKSVDVKANITPKKGDNLNVVKQEGKTGRKKFLLVLLFVFGIIVLFILLDVIYTISIKHAEQQQNIDVNQNINISTVDENVVDNNSIILKDTDGDELTDIEERTYGTDVGNIDTDKDYLSDSDEIKKYKSNPLNPDTDGDGISDYDEVFIYRSNPLNSDTDGDGYRDMDEINNGYSPIDNSKMTEEYIKYVEDQIITKQQREKLTQ